VNSAELRAHPPQLAGLGRRGCLVRGDRSAASHSSPEDYPHPAGRLGRSRQGKLHHVPSRHGMARGWSSAARLRRLAAGGSSWRLFWTAKSKSPAKKVQMLIQSVSPSSRDTGLSAGNRPQERSRERMHPGQETMPSKAERSHSLASYCLQWQAHLNLFVGSEAPRSKMHTYQVPEHQ
jgi:hypothetical protein